MVFDKKYFLFIFLLLSILSVRSSLASTETFMNSSIALKENIFVSVSTDKSSYCEPELVNITTILENRGNAGASGNLTTRIFNPYGSEIKNNTWQDSLSGGEAKNFITNHTVQSSDATGLYPVRSNFSYNNEYKNSETEFRIKSGIGSLVTSPTLIEMTAMPGDSTNKTLYLWLLYPCYDADAYLNKSSGSPGNWTNLSTSSVHLSQTGSVQMVEISISVPKDARTGDYTGYVYANAEGQQRTLTILIHVNASAIFDLSVSVPSEKKEVCQDSDIYAIVTVSKFYPSGVTDINMTYKLTDHTDDYFDKKNETIAIDTSVQRIPTLHVPSNLDPGYYTFVAILNYKEVEVTSTDIFQVKNCVVQVSQPPSGGGGVMVAPSESKKLVLNVSTNRLVTIIGNDTGFTATVANLGTKTELVEIVIDGIPSSWITISPMRASIQPSGSQKYVALIKIPKDALEGVYYLNVTAFDSTKSNEEKMMLIIGKDWKSAADLLLRQLEETRSSAEDVFFLECFDLTEFNRILEDGDNARDLGLEEYTNGNYEKAIDFYDYAISLYEKIINQADAILQINSKESNIFPFPLFAAETSYNIKILERYADERSYKEFCDTFLRIQQLSGYSKILFVLSFLLIALVIFVIVYFSIREYKRRKEKKVEERYEKIKERLKESLKSE